MSNLRPVKARCDGMTLVEVLIAASIFALIMTGALSAFAAFASAYERLQSINERTATLREVSRFLRQSLTDIVRDGGWFSAQERELSWLTPLDRAGSVSGLQYLKLSVSGDELVLSFAPYDPELQDAKEPDWGAVAPDFTLVPDLVEARFAYKATPESQWSSAMASDDPGNTYPMLVSIGVIVEDGEWPPIIVAFDK